MNDVLEFLEWLTENPEYLNSELHGTLTEDAIQIIYNKALELKKKIAPKT